MKIAHFFIDRPVFAIVLSIVALIAGSIAVSTLAIAQYPQIAPPTVTFIRLTRPVIGARTSVHSRFSREVSSAASAALSDAADCP